MSTKKFVCLKKGKTQGFRKVGWAVGDGTTGSKIHQMHSARQSAERRGQPCDVKGEWLQVLNLMAIFFQFEILSFKEMFFCLNQCYSKCMAKDQRLTQCLPKHANYQTPPWTDCIIS